MIPTPKDVFVTSCDGKYLQTYGPAFVASARDTRNPVHLHIVNPSPEDMALLARMSRFYDDCTSSIEQTDLYHLTPEQRNAYYASARYHVVADILTRHPKARTFVMDIDSVFRRHFEYHPHHHPIGLYFRDPVAHGARSELEMKGMRVLAVCWIWGDEARPASPGGTAYACAVSDYLKTHTPRWFIDQEALAECYDKCSVPATDLSESTIIDWEMRPYTVIWTAKGNRKHTNAQFKSAMKHAAEQFFAEE
jgi:hypothetical protein